MTVLKSRLIEARIQYVRPDLTIEQAIIDDAIPRAFRYARLGLTDANSLYLSRQEIKPGRLRRLREK